MKLPKVCGTCTFLYLDNELNRKRIGNVEYPYCPYTEGKRDLDDACEKHQISITLLMMPELYKNVL